MFKKKNQRSLKCPFVNLEAHFDCTQGKSETKDINKIGRLVDIWGSSAE